MILTPKLIITPALEAPWIREPQWHKVYTDKFLLRELTDEFNETFAMRRILLDAETDPVRRKEYLTNATLMRQMVIFGLTHFKDDRRLRRDWLYKPKRPPMTVAAMWLLDSDDWAWIDWECVQTLATLGRRVDRHWVLRQSLLLARERMKWYREDPKQWEGHPVLARAWAHKRKIWAVG